MTSHVIAGLVRDGLFHHRSGRLDQARQVYGQILASHPDQPGVLHLVGVLLHQMGDHIQGSESIARAITLRPNEAHFHSNLAEIYWTLGQFSMAKGSRILALRLQSDLFENPNHFDILLFPGPWKGDEVASSHQFSTNVPEAALEQDRIANEFRAQGDRELAIHHGLLALSIAPGVGELLCNLGLFLLESGRLREALHHCTEAVRRSPFLPQARNNLGNVLRALGRTMEAKQRYLEALRLDPDLTAAYRNLGRILQADGREAEAVTWYRLALALKPKSVETCWNLASALKELGQFDEARSLCEAALRLKPDSVESRTTLGSIDHEQGRNEEAAQHFEKAIGSNPRDLPALCSLGLIQVENGDFRAAESCFRQVLRFEEGHSRALYELASILRGELPDADLARIERLLADPACHEVDRVNLHFGAAQVLDARMDFSGAAQHLRRANSIQLALTSRTGRDYWIEEHDAFIEQITLAFPAAFFDRVKAWGSTSQRPVFIFGLPRSGTTLTEQILAGHSRVYGAGETPLARRGFEKLVGMISAAKSPADCLEILDEALIARFAEEYLDGLDAINRDAPFVVDKLPENYFYLGFLATLFPRSRFVHCRRDLRDTAVSCWSTHFRKVPWANDFEHIATRFAAYRRIMDYWSRTLPVPILEVDYEETVDDLEGVARRLVAWCGLDWEPACLAFHKSPRPIQTASMTQVRQPIYRRSVERWRNYEAELRPLFERLEQIDAEPILA